MATELPEEPKSRKEQYLADIAGQDVELPAEPKSREEQYLAYIAENGGGGGGGGTSNFNQLTNRPKYNGTIMTGDTNIPEVKTYTAGSNITISGNEISATDTTYSAGTGLTLTGTEFSADTTVLATQNDLSSKQNTLTAGSNITISDNTISATDTTYSAFTGTDGTAAGTAGLVPAPATTDAGKFLKADGTWDTAGGGSGPTVVQTTGTSTTDVMSQNAVTSMVFADSGSNTRVRIGAGADSVGQVDGVSIGKDANSGIGIGKSYIVGIGSGAKAKAETAVAIGVASSADGKGSIALGARAAATAQGEMNIGTSLTSYGYNSSNYRLLTGLYDPQSAHDAATKGYVDARTLTNAGAPTTATVGTVGQLLEDTTNGKLYICTAVIPGTDPDPDTYTWVEVGAGGGGPTVVQSTGTSTTDVMSQNAVTKFLANASSSGSIGVVYDGSVPKPIATSGTYSSSTGGSVILSPSWTYGCGNNNIIIGNNQAGPTSYISNLSDTVSIGNKAHADYRGSIALGSNSKTSAVGEMNIGSTSTSDGYNSSKYRLLTGLYDPQSAHDAATKGYVDPTTDSSAPTTATVGRLGQIQIDTTNADAYMCVGVDDVTPSYTWKKITA